MKLFCSTKHSQSNLHRVSHPNLKRRPFCPEWSILRVMSWKPFQHSAPPVQMTLGPSKESSEMFEKTQLQLLSHGLHLCTYHQLLLQKLYLQMDLPSLSQSVGQRNTGSKLLQQQPFPKQGNKVYLNRILVIYYKL